MPATCTVEPTTTARENPATGSNGECPEIRRRSIVEGSIAHRDGGPAPDRRPGRSPFAAAGVTRRERRRSRPTGTRAALCAGVGLEARQRARDPRRRRGGGRRPRRAGRPSRLDRAASARPRVRAAVRRYGADRASRAPPDLLQRGVRGARRTRRAACGDAVRRLRARGGLRAARPRPRPDGPPRRGDARLPRGRARARA